MDAAVASRWRRFGYSEVDEIDVISGAYWNMVRRIQSTFADYYDIGDDRTVDEDGIIYVPVTDRGNTELTGVAAYFPPENGDVYAMLVDFNEDTDVCFRPTSCGRHTPDYSSGPGLRPKRAA